MSLRDLLIFAVVLGGLPFMVRRPYVGVLYWVLFGVMNPHRLSWGAAYDFPFSELIAGATLLGLLFSSDERRFKGGAMAAALIVFMVWMSVTTLFALHPESAGPMWERVLKIQLMTWVGLMVLASKSHVNLLVGVLVCSIGFYGVKGGLFTLREGGAYRVWGPEFSFIADNNSLALALVMTIPLMYYLFHIAKGKWARSLLAGAMILTAAAALGSQSRGALVAILAMAVFLWRKSPAKIISGPVLMGIGTVLVFFMPESWWVRMATIGSYEQDTSAMGRINSWWTAWNLARDRLLGGGFEYYWPDVFARYAPNPEALHSAHSIYFQVLGEHGFIGLFFFLLIWWLAWRCASWVRNNSEGDEQWAWAGYLASMIQVSLVGYAVGGLFQNLAYWDLPYYEVVILAVLRDLIRRSQMERVAEAWNEPAVAVSPQPSSGIAARGGLSSGHLRS